MSSTAVYPQNGNIQSGGNASSECLVRIDPESGRVLGWVDLRGLVAQQSTVQLYKGLNPPSEYPYSSILSSIAYLPADEEDLILVTGKWWDHIYALRVLPAPNLGPEHVESVCGLSSQPTLVV